MEHKDDILMNWVIANDYAFGKSDKKGFKALFEAAREHFTDDEILAIMQRTWGHQTGNIYSPLKYFATIITGEARTKKANEQERLKRFPQLQPEPQPEPEQPIITKPEPIKPEPKDEGFIFYGYDKNGKAINLSCDEADKGVAEVLVALRKLANENQTPLEKLARKMTEDENDDREFVA